VDPPEGFAFGDIVSIEKKVSAGHLIVARQSSYRSITFQMHGGNGKQGHGEGSVI